MKPKTNKEVCASYQSRKRERTVAADRRRLAARTRSQSKREQPLDPAAEVAAWSAKRLKVPPGHARSGQPMELPKFAVDFLRDALQPDCHTAWLLVGRKNGKSQALASLVLAYLADGGPLRRAGFRCAVVSVTKPKAAELKKLAQDTAEASGLRGLTFPRSPAPGRIVSRWGTCEILSASDYEGHASGFDLVLLDEPGLLPERYRALIAGLKSSLTARRGRMICLSIVSDSPFTAEAISLKGHEGVAVHHYAGDEGCAIDDPVQLRKANPGIESGILHLEDLVRDARLAKKIPANEPHYRAHHLNARLSPTKELICSPSDWQKCVVKHSSELPPRTGEAWIGFDPGGSASLTATCTMWANGRTEFHSAVAATPSLESRGVSDGCGGLYVQAASRGELRAYSGKVTPIRDFLAAVIHDLAGVDLVGGGSDQYRRSEVEQVLDDPATGVEFDWTFRRMGSGPSGSADVRAFQTFLLKREIKTKASLLFAYGLASATIARDGNGNPSLLRSGRGRIDLVSAACLASGLRSAAVGDSGFGVSQRAVT